MDSSDPACTQQTVEEPPVLWLDYVAGHRCPADRVSTLYASPLQQLCALLVFGIRCKRQLDRLIARLCRLCCSTAHERACAQPCTQALTEIGDAGAKRPLASQNKPRNPVIPAQYSTPRRMGGRRRAFSSVDRVLASMLEGNVTPSHSRCVVCLWVYMYIQYKLLARTPGMR